MKTSLLSLALSLLCVLGALPQAKAQIRYESTLPGNWNTSIWRVTDLRPGVNPAPNPFPLPDANNIVVVNNPIFLNINYNVVGDNGLLTVNAGGSLSHNTSRFVLDIGDRNAPPVRNPQPRIVLASQNTVALNLYQLQFHKALGSLNAPIILNSCITFGNNTDLTLTSSVFISGNLVVLTGNSSINNRTVTAGSLIVAGQLDGNNNSIRNFNTSVTIVGTTIECQAVPLPVELTRFAAVFENNSVQLRWTTASEKDAANFSIERSFDGQNFSAVAVVPAAGTSATRREYQAIDRGMRSGLNYYRLKQTDLDGTFAYSQVLPVQVGEVAQQLEAYSSQGNLNIVLQMPGTLQQLRVLDSMGRVLYTETLSEGATGLVTRTIPMAGGAENRVYMVQAVTSQGVVNKKFMTVY
ncbi:hypothetical protein [uncultured Hymenobacter sp.]|uniref:hypothetical protein n=1 Tax=uncultured Hymenobacter sp. TaxID=170016 RepID=UPI0035C9A9A3